MPYPALPPDQSPAIAAPACEEISCSNPAAAVASPVVVADVGLPQTAAPSALARPTPPENFAPELSPATTLDQFKQQTGRSSAALLSDPESADEPEPRSFFVPPAAPARKTTAIPPYVPPPSPRSPQLTRIQVTGAQVPNSQTSAAPAPNQGSRLSTASTPAAQRSATVQPQSRSQEADLMTQVDRSLRLNQLYEDFAPGLTGLLADLDRRAQADDPLSNDPASSSDPQSTTQPSSTPPPPTPPAPSDSESPAPQNGSPATQTSPPAPGQPSGSSTPPTPTPTTPIPPGTSGVIELTADRQEFDERRQIFTAEGKVLMRFQGSLLDADRLQVNLVNRVAVAEGNVALTRGNQVLRGQRFRYNFVQGVGTVFNASGEIFLPTTDTDLNVPTGGESATGTVTLSRPVSDRIISKQPTQNVTSDGGISVSAGAGRDVGRVPGALPQGGQIRRLRFEAEQLDFTPLGWEAKKIDITNDPFSPPELVLRAERATFTRLSPLRDEIRATRPRLVFDQRLSIPTITRVVLDRRKRPPPLIQFGFDSEDRGGLYAERTFNILNSDRVQLSLTPQVFLQKAIFDGGGPFDASNYGLLANLDADLGPRTTIRGRATFTSLDFNDFEEEFRASIRGQQLVGTHTLSLEYSYRDRLFNGSLGFQTVQSSVGAVFASPLIPLGNSGINLRYQAGIQNITADTDRVELLEPIRDNNRVNLTRYQGSVELSRGFLLWQGKALPATPTQGLRYTPVPLVPYISLGTTLRGVISGYSSGDNQRDLLATAELTGQFGHHSRPFLDYTAFRVAYTQVIGGGASPFLFDRTVDNRILTLGLTQQLYGPVRIGFQTSFNLDNGDSISTDYFLEYSRRAYGILVRYNPTLSIGSISLRISDFNWTGGTTPFDEVTPVEAGVRQPSQ